MANPGPSNPPPARRRSDQANPLRPRKWHIRPPPGRWPSISHSCLGDNCPHSVVYGSVESGQVRLGGHSVQPGLVRCSCGLWNDCETARRRPPIHSTAPPGRRLSVARNSDRRRPRPSNYETDARRRCGRLQTDLAHQPGGRPSRGRGQDPDAAPKARPVLTLSSYACGSGILVCPRWCDDAWSVWRRRRS
jgi:hypothetical protein